MSQIVDAAPTRAAGVADRLARHHEQPAARHARLWALLEALGDAGALVDPTGVLAAQRFRRAEDEEVGHGRH